METQKERILSAIKRFKGINQQQIVNRLGLSKSSVIKRVSDLKYEGKIIEKKKEYHFVENAYQPDRSSRVKEMRFQKYLQQGMKRYGIDAVTLGRIASDRRNNNTPATIEVPETLNQIVFDELVKAIAQLTSPNSIEMIASSLVKEKHMFFSFYAYSGDNINRILAISKIFQESGGYNVRINQKPEIDKQEFRYTRTFLQIQITQK